MSADPVVRDVQAVQIRRRDRVEGEPPVVTLTARVALAGPVDVRVTHRPVVAVLADGSGGAPRLELHVDGGSSVVLEGPPLAELLRDALDFLKRKDSGAERQHDHVFGLVATFDLAMSPFVTLEQPPFLAAEARTFVHPSGAVALRLLGEKRARTYAPEHARPETAPPEREAFDLLLQARRAPWLVATLEEALRGLSSADSGVKA